MTQNALRRYRTFVQQFLDFFIGRVFDFFFSRFSFPGLSTDWPVATKGGHLKLGRLKMFRSGKTDPVQFKGRFKHNPFCLQNGRFATSFLLSRIGFLEASKKANLCFKRSFPKPHLNWTGSVFALPKCDVTAKVLLEMPF